MLVCLHTDSRKSDGRSRYFAERNSSQGVLQVTPEAVIYRYLLVANSDSVVVPDLVRLIGTDADLLGHWLNLMKCRASPEVLNDALEELDPNTLKRLAQAQAWSVLPGVGTARLGLDQWQIVLRAACLGHTLAGYVGLTELETVRWKILLAISGVNLSFDHVVGELIEFRGSRAELLEDASPLLKVFAVVDTMETADEAQASLLASRLLGIDEGVFAGICEQAHAECQDLLNRCDLLENDDDVDVDWAERFWTQLQVSMLAALFSDCKNLAELYAAHRIASRSLFSKTPLLLLLDDDGQALQHLKARDVETEAELDVQIRLSSSTSVIARTVRDGTVLSLTSTSQAAVADRQLLHALKTGEGLCVPLSSNGQNAGALVFAVEQDVDLEFAMCTYAQELARPMIKLRTGLVDEVTLLTRYRQREEKRLREIVHEANNPLSIVHNYLHILALRLQHEPTASEQLDMIGTELKRAGELFQKVKDTAEIEVDDSAMFAEFDVNELARTIFELHRGYAEGFEVSLQLELSLGMLPLTSDEQRLSQVLNNLMRNAIEASSGQSVTVLSYGGVFREGLEGVEIAVRDTGPGLARAVLDKLAEPKDSTKGESHAGLGLHIVHRIVAELNGNIDVRTLTGQGTTFTVFLPLNPPV